MTGGDDDRRSRPAAPLARIPLRRLPREQWSAHDLGRRAPFGSRPAAARRGDAGAGAVSEVAAEPTLPLALAEVWDLRRLGLFDDDGRAPPSWNDR